jgi:hypothetical protein
MAGLVQVTQILFGHVTPPYSLAAIKVDETAVHACGSELEMLQGDNVGVRLALKMAFATVSVFPTLPQTGISHFRKPTYVSTIHVHALHNSLISFASLSRMINIKVHTKKKLTD